jgi:hypothetical protein
MTAPAADPEPIRRDAPPRWVAVGHSSQRQAAAAVEEALASLLVRGQPKLVMVFASPNHSLEAVTAQVRQRIGAARLIGCSTAGELAPGRSGMGGLVLWALGGVDVPLVGGCAGDDLAMKRTHQIHGDQVLTQAVVAAVISSDAPPRHRGIPLLAADRRADARDRQPRQPHHQPRRPPCLRSVSRSVTWPPPILPI